MAFWPTSIATDAQLYVAVNLIQTILPSAIDSSVIIIPVSDITGFPTAGAIAIDTEVIFYTGITGNTFTGCTRGSDGTTATSHSAGVSVLAAIVAKHHNVLKDEIEAIETSLNFTASRALASNGSGRAVVSAVTSAELSYLSGVTSAIQTQFTGKKSIATGNAYKFETTDTSGNLQETTVTASRALETDSNGLPIASVTLASELDQLSGVTSSGIASKIPIRDSNINFQVNEIIQNFTTQVTNGTTTTLTGASSPVQAFTGTSNQTIVLPDATTLAIGFRFLIQNRSTGFLTIQKNGGTTIAQGSPFTDTELILTSVSTAAGFWNLNPLSHIFKYKSTAVSYTTAGEIIIGVTDTSSSRTITLSDPDKLTTGTTGVSRLIQIKDESGAAATHNIIISPASGTIDGTSSVSITENYGSKIVYSNGSNWFTLVDSSSANNTLSNLLSPVAINQNLNNFSAGIITASLTGHSSLDLALTGGTMSGSIAFGGTSKLTGLAAGTTNGDSLRYEQLIGVYALGSEPYVTIGNTSGLSAERALTGTANQIIITDNGANSTVVLSLPQPINAGANPTFAGLDLTNTTAQIVLGTTRTITLDAPTPAGSSRTYHFPDMGSDSTVLMTGLAAQTINSTMTWNTGQIIANLGSIGNPGLALNGTSKTSGLTGGSDGLSLILVTNATAALTIDSSQAASFSGTLSSGAYSSSGSLSSTLTSNQLILGTTRTVTITAPTPASSSRTWTLPDLSTSPTFAALEGTQTFTGAKTFTSDLTLSKASPGFATTDSGTSYAFHSFKNNNGTGYIGFESNAGGSILTGSSGNAFVISQANAYSLEFGTSNVKRFTIDSGGVSTFLYQLIGKGTSTNDSASAGYIGEYISNYASSVNASNNTYVNVASIALTAGDWDVSGVFSSDASGVVTRALMAVSAFSGNTTTDHQNGDNVSDVFLPTAASNGANSIPNWRVSITGNTTIYLKGRLSFATGTPQMDGRISARRVR